MALLFFAVASCGLGEDRPSGDLAVVFRSEDRAAPQVGSTLVVTYVRACLN